jgi:hypothetical protein
VTLRLTGALRTVVIALGVVAIGSGVALSPTFLVYLLALMFSSLLMTVVLRVCADPDPESQARIRRWTLLSFGAHLGFAIFTFFLTPLWRYIGPDAIGYHKTAIDLSLLWHGIPTTPDLSPGKEGFPYMLGALYWLGRPSFLAGLILNASFAAALVPIVSDTTRRLFGTDASRYVAPIVTVLPAFLVWPSQLLREAGVLLFIAIASNALIRMAKRPSAVPVFIFAGSLALMFTFRGYLAAVIALTMVFALVLRRRQRAAGAVAGLSALAVLTFLVAGLGIGYSGYRVTTDKGDLRYAQEVRSDFSQSGSSGFDTATDISTPRRAVTYLPVGVVRLMFGPFPWQAASARQVPAVADSIALYCLYPLAWLGIRKARGQASPVVLLLLPAMAVAGSLGLVVANFGTTVRDRTQVLLLLLPFIAYGIAERQARRRQAPPLDEPLLVPSGAREIA